MILSGDIGGTNTRLALFEGGKKIIEAKYRSKNYRSLEDIIDEFLKKNPMRVSKAGFGVAGPVQEGRCHTTNLAWTVDAQNIQKHLGIKSCVLMNDLEAKAYGIRVLKKDELFCLNKGKEQKGNRALIAAGTGLGEAGLYFDGHQHRPFACEGGHVDFAPRNPLEVELLFYLQKSNAHVSYERVVSGPGLYALYQFLVDTGKEKKTQLVEEAMGKKDAPLIVSEYGLLKKDAACERALDLFLSIYGAAAGNLALKFLSLGGMYIGGGIAPFLVGRMKTGDFLPSFFNKGRFKALLESIPIWVIMNDDASLLGVTDFVDKGE